MSDEERRDVNVDGQMSKKKSTRMQMQMRNESARLRHETRHLIAHHHLRRQSLRPPREPAEA